MVFCGFLSKLCNSSSVKTDMPSMYSEELYSYISACQKDPDLKSFDLLLHQQVNKIISSLASRADSQTLPIDLFKGINGLVLQMNEDAVKLIIGSREDVRKNKYLKSYVDVYFESIRKTFEFCNLVENCVKRAEESYRIIQLAVNEFDIESAETEDKIKYAKTLEELKKFKAMGDPFEGDFLNQYVSVCEQQVLVLEELSKQKVKLKNVKAWRKLSNGLFALAFTFFMVIAAVAATVGTPLILSLLADVLSPPSEYGGKWCGDMLKAYEKALKSQKDLVFSMKVQAMINKNAVEHIMFLVAKLRYTIASIFEMVEYAVEREEDEDAMRLVMQEIKKIVGQFEWQVKDANDLIKKKTIKLPANSASEQGNW